MSESENRELIAARIKEARLAAHLTQAEVAELMKVARVSITIMETGKRNVTADEILRLAKIFGVGPLFLLGQSPHMLAADDPKVQLATRELHKLQPTEITKLLDVLAGFRDDNAPKNGKNK